MTYENTDGLWQAVQANNQRAEVQAREGIPQTSGKAFVLLHDVQDIFPGAHRLMDGKRSLAFMVDKAGNKIHPLRIPHLPSVVLDVVTADNPPSARSSCESDTRADVRPSIPDRHSSRPRITSQQPPRRPENQQQRSETPPQQQSETPPQKQSEQKTTQQSQPAMDNGAPTAGNPDQVKAQYRKSVALYQSFLQHIRAGQTEEADRVRDDFRLHFQSLEAQMSKNQDAQKRMVEMQQTMLQMQLQSLDRLAGIQNSVQAILVQNYELHEYPIPRLFVVLPQDSSRWDNVNVSQNKFRLHFLCECGEHTKSMHSTTPHHVHLAKHEGYDLERSGEFFLRYGGYVLKMLQMLKYGVSAAGFVVPAMNSFDNNTRDIETGVNQVTTYLKNLPEYENLEVKCDDNNSSSDAAVSLLGRADLRKLRTFLKITIESRVLGNLYRVVTREGHVKWVCLDHSRDNYNVSAMKELVEIASINGGSFDEHHGRIEVSLSSPMAAAQFYKVLDGVRSVQELKITLAWDISFADAKSLRDAMYGSNVAIMELTCTASNSPAELLNRSKRAEPLWQILTNPKIRSFSLSGYTGFFRRGAVEFQLNDIRVLKIAEQIDWKKDAPRIMDLFKMSPRLAELCLGCSNIKDTYQPLRDAVVRRCALAKLTLESFDSGEKLVARYGEDRALGSMDLVISNLLAYKSILQNVDCLSTLQLTSQTNGYSDCTPLLEVVNRNRSLTEIKVACYVSEFLTIYETIRNMVMASKRSSRLKKLCFHRGNNQLYTPDIRMPQLLVLELMQMKVHETSLLQLLNAHGSKLTKLRIDSSKWKPVHSIALLTAIRNDPATATTSRLTHLYQTCSGVDENILPDLSEIIHQSNLKEYELIVDQPFWPHVELAKHWVQYIHSIGIKLTSLFVTCPEPNEWTEAINGLNLPVMKRVSFMDPRRHKEKPIGAPMTMSFYIDQIPREKPTVGHRQESATTSIFRPSLTTSRPPTPLSSTSSETSSARAMSPIPSSIGRCGAPLPWKVSRQPL